MWYDILRGFTHVPCRTFFWLMNVRIFSLPYSLLLDYSHLGSLPYPTLPEIEKPLPFRAWLPHLKLLILASTAQIVRSASSCQNSGHIPNVRVADSQHLLVNWENALEGCDSSKVQFAIVRIGSVQVGVIFDDKEAKLNADPCLEHPGV